MRNIPKTLCKIWLVGSIIWLSTFVLMSLAHQNYEPPKAPTRPEGVPLDAFWSGGIDGGSWFLCNSLELANRYRCKVFDDYSGQLTVDTEFERKIAYWDKENRVSVIRDFDDIYLLPGSFDGSQIYLGGTMILVPLVPIFDD